MTDREMLDRLLVLNEYGFCVEIPRARWEERWSDGGRIEFLSDEMLTNWFGPGPFASYIQDELDALALVHSA